MVVRNEQVELLERSTELAALENALDDVRQAGRGALALVAGEAGIGKSALLDAFCQRHKGVPTARGACEALFTPRPLGPILEIAQQLGGDLARVSDGGITTHAVAQ